MYCKRVMILQQTDKRFAERNRELCGMVKLVNNSATETVVTVFVTNADNGGFGQWWLLLNFGDAVYAKLLSDLNNRVFSLPVKNLDNVGCLLVKREGKCYEAARGNFGDVSLCDKLARNMDKLIAAAMSKTTQTDYSAQNVSTLPGQAERQVTSADAQNGVQNVDASVADGEDTTRYEEFVASTADYYTDMDLATLRKTADGRYKSVEDYSDAFDRFYATGADCDYYETVKREIGKLFVEFPPYFPLIKKYEESFFVRIDFPSSDKYFVLGVLQREGKVRYICYGLPAEKDGFFDKDFVYVDSTPVAFWMLFQDADNGKITTFKQPVAVV